jgi:predicted metalloprotease
MRWRRGGSGSGNVIDRRGARAGGMPGGRVALPGGLGLAGVIVFLAIQLLGGGAAFDVPSGFDDGTSAPDAQPIPADQDPEKDLKDFSAYVFDNTQDMWRGTLKGYRDAKLVLYRDAVSTGCGSASSAVGPFYCPEDERVYLDLTFYRDMERKLGAPGDFAWAYVIAHEVGHHVQKLTGTNDEVRNLQRDNPGNANALSVRLELQADCYAGVWAHSVFEAGDLEPGDVEEALTAAGAVGDDRLQRRAGGDVRPDTFTHGTSEQRIKWFRKGQDAGEPAACDTFSADDV